MNADTNYDVIVVGGGPAGMAAAMEAHRTNGCRVLLLERDEELGGILPQCIHNGFGALRFGADLPGPEYAYRDECAVRALPIDIQCGTMVVSIDQERNIHATSKRYGYQHFRPAAIVLAMGCRERTRAQIRLPGTRAAGVFTAGTAQRLVNRLGYMPGNEVVVLGSGDIGMIMARRLTIEGAKVHAVVELQPHLTGLRRNYVQCLSDYGIPLILSTTVTRILGDKRVTGVEIAQVDDTFQPVSGTERVIACDTLVLSVGLIPENELSHQAGVVIDPRTNGPVVDQRMATSVPGIFAAGNVTTIYDLVDYVSSAGEIAGQSAAQYVEQSSGESSTVLAPGTGVASVIPQRIGDEADGNNEPDQRTMIGLRPRRIFDERVTIEIKAGEETILRFREPYARPAEMIVHSFSEADLARARLAAAGQAGGELTAHIVPAKGQQQ